VNCGSCGGGDELAVQLGELARAFGSLLLRGRDELGS
jgi:hypothetical protein